MRLGDPIDPVVVLLGQRPGAGRGGEDLLEAGEVLWPVREVRSGALHDVPRARPDAFDTRVGMLTVRSQALPEQSDELRWVGGPSRRFDIEVLLPDVAVHVEERVELARELGPVLEPDEIWQRAFALRDRRRDGGKPPGSLGECVQVALEALQGRRVALRDRERLGPIRAHKRLVCLGELFHHRIGRACDDEMDGPDTVYSSPHFEPRFGEVVSRQCPDRDTAHPFVMPSQLG